MFWSSLDSLALHYIMLVKAPNDLIVTQKEVARDNGIDAVQKALIIEYTG
jgi:hypothetical protein